MSRRSDRQRPEFVFVPIGGVGEIGMNLYLYGYGPADDREWLIVDLGITFGGDTEPGIDVILPDITFLEAERPNLKGLLLTHAHEDHFGAVVDLWPRLGGVQRTRSVRGRSASFLIPDYSSFSCIGRILPIFVASGSHVFLAGCEVAQ